MTLRKLFLQLLILTGFAFTVLQACKHQPVAPVPPITPPDTIPTGGGGGGCDPDTVYFQNKILPLLTTYCAMPNMGCHDAQSAADGVILTDYNSIMNTADVRPGNPRGSDLYEVLVEDDADKRMPKEGGPLTPEQIKWVWDWITQGAKDNYCLDDCDTTNITYTTKIKPIFDLNCKGCHRAGQVNGGIRLDNYNEAEIAAFSGKLLPAILHQNTDPAKNMPQPIGSPQLDSCKINAIRIWIETGTPE